MPKLLLRRWLPKPAVPILPEGEAFLLTLDYDGSLTQGIDMYTPVSYTLYAYVRSDLTARDIYAESIVLRYCKPIVNMAPYVLAISLIMILLWADF